jgi:tetratricopeptide (TPR) repeat protein
MELQKLYDAAEKARASGDWEQAMALLDQVRAKNPAYKDVAAKINELDSLLEAKTKKDVLAAMYEQAQKYEAEGNLEMAITSYENLLQQDASFRDASAKLQQAREQLEQKQLSEKLESEYAAGLQALKTQDWTSAVLAFEKVLELDRDHRDAHRRLAAAKKGLERESTETILARYYAEGVTAMNNNDLGGALAALEKVRQLNPAYRDVADLLSALEVKLAGPAPSPATNAAALPASVDSLYQEALSSMDKEDWVQAVVALEKIQLLQPNYRDVGDRLTVARVNLNNAAIIPKSVEPPVIGNTPLYVGSALTALIVLPLLGFIVFSPATRARIHCWRGNYMAAAQTYERILTRHPGRLRLYPTLANIYLLLGRKDEGALKVFKTILQLNLATRNREEINAIVAQNYLTEGRMDADAIEVLESALEAERRKQSPV